MSSRRNDRSSPEAPFGERPYCGWAWRGTALTDRQWAFFIPGRVVKHLGIPSLRVGRPSAWPVHFAVYVHRGWRRGRKIALPADACFEILAVRPLPGGGTCLVLEQIEEGTRSPSAFRRSLERWLGRYAADLAQPSETERRELGQPFARWLPQSRPGDPPLEGPIHDFEDAVRYASAWSGVEEELTWRILGAFERCLELAGIERTIIAAVHRGKMAYLDHLGLVSWDHEGEREAQLGTPAWPLGGALASVQST